MATTGQFEVVARGKREWEQMFDALAEPLEMQDGYRIRRANLALASLSKLPIQQIPGRDCHAVLANRDSPCTGCPLIGALETGQSASGEVALDDGRIFEVSAFPISGEASGWAVQHRDVTAHRQAATRLQEAQRLAAVGRLAAGASHEINNPLSVITANLEGLGQELVGLAETNRHLREALRLANEGKDAKAAAELRKCSLRALGNLETDGPELIEDGLSSARRVAAIVRALRLLATERQEPFQSVDARDLLVHAAKRATDEAGVFTPIEWDQSVALPLYGQPAGLAEAFYQIVRNAIQSGNPGRAVRLGCSRSDNRALITVTDHGRGIPASIRDRMFEPFFTTRPMGQGLGLGLTTSYGIVQKHGGEMEVQTHEGVGTTINVFLPAGALPSSGGGTDPEGRGIATGRGAENLSAPSRRRTGPD